MNLKLLLFFALLKFGLCNAQLKPALIILKSGEKFQEIGKIKASTFKYKSNDEAKAQEFEFSKIKSVELEDFSGEKIVYNFYPLKNSDSTYIAVQPVITGKKAELYITTENYVRHTNNGIGAGFDNVSVVNYFVKKQNEDKLTELGVYSPLINNLKERVMDYFKDCEILINNLENRELKVREGLEKIVNFYNQNCN
jgi:hypothetical protein